MILSRRRFATMIGAATAGAAFAPTLLGRATAQAPRGPMRFLAVRTPHGVQRDFWIPRMPNGSEPPNTEHMLEELTFDYDDAILTPLQDWRNKITVLDGLDTQIVRENVTEADGSPRRSRRRNLHGHEEQGCVLTGAQPNDRDDPTNFDMHPSLDFFLHQELGATALLTASVEGTGDWKCMSYDERGLPRTPVSDPRQVFRAAFPSDFVPPMAGPPPVDYRAGEQRIASYGTTALQRFRERLRGDERLKLDSHLAAHMRLAQPTGGDPQFVGACMTSGMDVPTRDGRLSTAADVEVVTRAHARVIAQAFACGRSRAATLQILNDFPNWFTDAPGVPERAAAAGYGGSYRFHENLVHDYWGNRNNAQLRSAYCAGLRWSATHFAAVLDELDDIVDPLDPSGGTVLDNTIVFWHNEFGHEGHDNQHTRHPCVIAGGGNRTLKLGRYLRLRNIASEDRVPHNLLLTSICHAMGLTSIEYFGDRYLDMPRHPNYAMYRGPLLPLMV